MIKEAILISTLLFNSISTIEAPDIRMKNEQCPPVVENIDEAMLSKEMTIEINGRGTYTTNSYLNPDGSDEIRFGFREPVNTVTRVHLIAVDKFNKIQLISDLGRNLAGENSHTGWVKVSSIPNYLNITRFALCIHDTAYLNLISDGNYINWTLPDNVPPTINSVNIEPSDWSNNPVSLVINATDNQSLHTTSYSFDNGLTWQASNTKTFTENKALDINVQDAKGNKSHRSISINNIDKLKPSKPMYSVK